MVVMDDLRCEHVSLQLTRRSIRPETAAANYDPVSQRQPSGIVMYLGGFETLPTKILQRAVLVNTLSGFVSDQNMLYVECFIVKHYCLFGRREYRG